MRKVLGASKINPPTKEFLDLSFIYLSKPYFDKIGQKWVSLCCSYYSMQAPFARPLTINGNTFTSLVISCVITDMTQLLDYKTAINNTKVLIPPSANQTLPSITNSYFIVADNNEDKILIMPQNLEANYNYTSVFSPDLVRYTGFTSKTRQQDLAKLDERKIASMLLNYSENIVTDPLDPTLITPSQIHVRSTRVSPKLLPDTTYSIRSMFYFNQDDLNASRSLITNNIAAAQYQITLLAIIIIIVICAVVICISFQ